MNPFRYRGYIYDEETGFYYCQSRYYDPEIGRFINSDNEALVTVTPESASWDKNLYAYCDNNPIVRVDHGGQFWDTIFDVVSLVSSVVEVCKNPTDPLAWAGLVGDAIDIAVPCVSGIGEITKSVSASLQFADTAYDATKAADNAAELAEVAGDIGKKAHIVDGDPFLPDSFYSKHAPKQSTPNSSYTKYTYNSYTGKYEKSTAYYDFAGRQNIRIDWTNHGYFDHGNPHVHYTIYNSRYRDGFPMRWD